jgi:regulator of cell morphogenesis and NO signaling
MSTTPAPSVITPDITLGALVAAQTGLARVFERLDLDYCCGGKQTLAAACARRGLDIATTIALRDSASAGQTAAPVEVDAAAMGLVELADHIVATHHAYLKTELPRLVEMADRVGHRHGWRDARLPEMAATVRELAQEMLSHMRKEEFVLFPAVREIEADLHRHVHKENNILFPRALALAS